MSQLQVCFRKGVQLLSKKHFQSLADQYEDKHALIYGRFRIERITEVMEKFILCGTTPRASPAFSAPIPTAGMNTSGRSPVRGFISVRPAPRNAPCCSPSI